MDLRYQIQPHMHFRIFFPKAPSQFLRIWNGRHTFLFMCRDRLLESRASFEEYLQHINQNPKKQSVGKFGDSALLAVIVCVSRLPAGAGHLVDRLERGDPAHAPAGRPVPRE